MKSVWLRRINKAVRRQTSNIRSYWRKGQSILEVVIALAVFVLFAASMVSLILGSFSALTQGGDYLTASALADEGLEAVRSIRDGAWNELIFNQSAATSTSGEWQFAGEGTDEQIGKFHRVLTFSPVCRDGSLNLTICPAGPVDLHSRGAQVMVDWTNPVGAVAAVERQTMFTNWDSRDWVQTDWSGGAGQSVWSDASRYESDDGKVDFSTVSELKLKVLPAAWSQVSSPVRTQLNDVYCIADNDCWAVGNAASGELLLRWDGVWTRVTPSASIPNVNLNAVRCSSPSNCFAVGASGTILRWNGTEWFLPAGWDTGNQTWNDVWVFGDTSGFVVGASGEIWRHNGSAWVRSQDTGNQTWNAVWMFSATDGVVVGSAGEIRRYDGNSWSLPAGWDTGNQTWNDVWMFSVTSGLVVGSDGQIRSYNGVDWSTPDATGIPANLNALVMISPASGWAVGNASSGELIYQRTSSGWSRVGPFPSLPNINLFSVFCLTANDCWAVGASGNIFRLSGGGYEANGSLISSAFDFGDPSPVQIIEWDEQIPVCVPASACNVKLKIRVADDSAMTGAVWSTDFTTAAGSLIDLSYNGKRWVQYRVLLNGDGASTPILNEVRINYK